MLKNTKRWVLLVGASVVMGVVIGGIRLLAVKPTRAATPHTTESGYFSPDGKYTEITETSTNYCHDAVKLKEWEGMLLKYPDDLGIIKLYALRGGLCDAVDKKKITLDMGIDIFNSEHQKLFLERAAQKDPDRQLTL